MIQLDAELINNHSTLQEHYGSEFLLRWKETEKKGNLDGETVMEIGCGPGNTSTRNILRLFPRVREIIATDASEGMIHLAKTQNAHPVVEYCVADAQDEFFFARYYDFIDKVFSFFALQWVKDQKLAFQNIFNVLKPGGEAALLFALRAVSFDASDRLKKDSKWKDILKDVNNFIPLSHSKGFDASYYREMFQGIGFEVLSCKTQENFYDHKTSEEYKKFLASICHLTKHVPDSKKEEFAEDLLQACRQLSQDDARSSPNTFEFTQLSVHLFKPAN